MSLISAGSISLDSTFNRPAVSTVFFMNVGTVTELRLRCIVIVSYTLSSVRKISYTVPLRNGESQNIEQIRYRDILQITMSKFQVVVHNEMKLITKRASSAKFCPDILAYFAF